MYESSLLIKRFSSREIEFGGKIAHDMNPNQSFLSKTQILSLIWAKEG